MYVCVCVGLCDGTEMWLDTCTPARKAYLTTPDVFLRTEAAKLWVTPTRLVPSTSTIWSFTLILARPPQNQGSVHFFDHSEIANIDNNQTARQSGGGGATKQLIVSH